MTFWLRFFYIFFMFALSLFHLISCIGLYIAMAFQIRPIRKQQFSPFTRTLFLFSSLFSVISKLFIFNIVSSVSLMFLNNSVIFSFFSPCVPHFIHFFALLICLVWEKFLMRTSLLTRSPIIRRSCAQEPRSFDFGQPFFAGSVENHKKIQFYYIPSDYYMAVR